MHSFRQFILSMVFKEFDLTEDGYIESAELLKLGKARRATGQKAGVWSDEQNRRLVAKIDQDGDGRIDESEFVHYFGAALSNEVDAFQGAVRQFMDVARLVRRKGHQGIHTPVTPAVQANKGGKVEQRSLREQCQDSIDETLGLSGKLTADKKADEDAQAAANAETLRTKAESESQAATGVTPDCTLLGCGEEQQKAVVDTLRVAEQAVRRGQGRVEHLSKEVENVRNLMSETQDVLDATESMLAETIATCEQQEGRCADLEAANRVLEAKCSVTAASLAESKGALAACKRELDNEGLAKQAVRRGQLMIAQLSKEVEEAKEEKAFTAANAGRAIAELELVAEKVPGLEAEVAEGERKLRDANKVIEEQQTELDNSQKEMVRLGNQVTEKMAAQSEAMWSLEHNRCELERGAAEVARQLVALETALQSRDDDVTALEIAKAALEESCEQLKDRKTKANATIAELELVAERVPGLEAEVAEGERSLEDASRVIEEQKAELDNWQNVWSAAQAEMANLANQMTEKMRQQSEVMRSLEDNRCELERSVVEVTGKLEGAVTESRNKVDGVLETYRRELAQLQVRVLGLEAEVAEGAEKLREAEGVIEKQKAELDIWEHDAEGVIEEQKAELETWHSVWVTAQTEMENLGNQLEMKKVECEAGTKEVLSLSSHVQALTSQVADLRSELEGVNVALKVSEAKRQVQQVSIDGLVEASLEHESEAMSLLERDHDELEQSVVEVTGKLEHVVAQTLRKVNEVGIQLDFGLDGIEELALWGKSQATELKVALQCREDEVRELKIAKAALEESCEQGSRTIAELELAAERVPGLEAEVAKGEQKVEDGNGMIVQLRRHITKLDELQNAAKTALNKALARTQEELLNTELRLAEVMSSTQQDQPKCSDIDALTEDSERALAVCMRELEKERVNNAAASRLCDELAMLGCGEEQQKAVVDTLRVAEQAVRRGQGRVEHLSKEVENVRNLMSETQDVLDATESMLAETIATCEQQEGRCADLEAANRVLEAKCSVMATALRGDRMLETGVVSEKILAERLKEAEDRFWQHRFWQQRDCEGSERGDEAEVVAVGGAVPSYSDVATALDSSVASIDPLSFLCLSNQELKKLTVHTNLGGGT